MYQIENLPSQGKILEKLASQLNAMTPEIRKAAVYVLENPFDVGISSIREISQAAAVSPNTFVRLAHSLECASYNNFRQPFREHIRDSKPDFSDRVRWLQSLSKEGKSAVLYAQMVESAISNIQKSFAQIKPECLDETAKLILSGRRTYIAGVGMNYAMAHNIAYLLEMAIDNVEPIPKIGSTAVDDLARAGDKDVMINITFKPYRTEIVEAVRVAKDQGVRTIAISDSPASPTVIMSDQHFIVATDTPQFFPSTMATLALLETLVAFIIANSSTDVIQTVKKFH